MKQKKQWIAVPLASPILINTFLHIKDQNDFTGQLNPETIDVYKFYVYRRNCH